MSRLEQSELVNMPELRAVLGWKNMPMWKLAAKMGIGPPSLGAYLRGKNSPPKDLQQRIEKALQLTPGRLSPKANTEQ